MLQLFDLILVGIMIISGLLALMRGFTREILSLAAWVGAAVAAFVAYHSPQLFEFARQYLEPDIVAKVATTGGVFVVVLILLSLIGVKLSDAVVDSAVGPFDRSLGCVYGLARGLVLVAIAYLIYAWFTPPDRREDWVRNAYTLPWVLRTSEGILSLVSMWAPDVAETVRNTAIAGNAGIDPGVKTNQSAIGEPPQPGEAPPPAEDGYKRGETQDLDNLIQGTQGGQGQTGGQPAEQPAEQPAFGGQTNPN